MTDHGQATSIQYEWRGAFSNTELNALHPEAFDQPQSVHDWSNQLDQQSLGWVTARHQKELVGFVNVAWDGRAHSFLLDTAVTSRWRHRGIGSLLVEGAISNAADAGCEWLHVDFAAGLGTFYLEECGFAPTEAGVMRLR